MIKYFFVSGPDELKDCIFYFFDIFITFTLIQTKRNKNQDGDYF